MDNCQAVVLVHYGHPEGRNRLSAAREGSLRRTGEYLERCGVEDAGNQTKAHRRCFAGHLGKVSDDECWDWIGQVTNGGHQTLGRGGKGRGVPLLGAWVSAICHAPGVLGFGPRLGLWRRDLLARPGR